MRSATPASALHWVLAFTALALHPSGSAVAQSGTRTSPTGTASGQSGDTRPAEPSVEPRLRPVLLDRAIFQPDHWWHYDGSDLYPKTKARFSAYALAQSGFVSLGRKSVMNSGARVLYGVIEYPSVADARKGVVPRDPHGGGNVRVYRRPLKTGDGGHVVSVITLDAKGVPQLCERRAYVRWGRFVMCVIGDSNMRAFVAKPAKGERPWLHEPVFERVLEHACSAWANVGGALNAQG